MARLPNAHNFPYSPTPLLLYSSTPLHPYPQPAFTSQHPLGNWSVFGLILLSFHLCPYYVPLPSTLYTLHSTLYTLHSPPPPLSSHSPTNIGIASRETQTHLYRAFAPHSSNGYTLVSIVPSLWGLYTIARLCFD